MTEYDPAVLTTETPEWMDFIQSMPGAMLFHHPAWIKLISEYYHFRPYYLIVRDRQGQISAGLPLMEVNGLMQHSKLVSLPFTDYCVPLFRDSADLNRLVSAIVSLYRTKKYQQLELRWEYPSNPPFYIEKPYVLHKVRLENDPDMVAARIKRKHFRHANVAKVRGVYTEMGTEIDQLRSFYKLHTENRRKHGVPVQPWAYFQSLYDLLLMNGYGFLINAYKDGVCIAAGLFLYWNRNLMVKYSATSEAGRQFSAMNLVKWEAICWGCAHSMDTFDMGRTDITDQGLRTFKKNLGAEETLLAYSYIPERQSDTHMERIITICQAILQHSPLWVCRLTGELFYQYFA